MSSLRRRLFLILLTATGLIWLSAVAWIGLVSRSELEHVLDTRLQEAARMVHSLVMAGDGAAAAFPETEPALAGSYERQLSCQVWSFDGRLIARSSGAPASEMASDREGFADREVNGETWRVYTIVDAQKGIRVVVGDRVGLRDRLVLDLIAGLAVPAVLVLPLLGLLIWWSLGQGLRPLRRVAADIAARDGEDMRPVTPEGAPSEIRPLIGALDGLFAKVEATRRHERDITAFAAHELRTPLAGLKTQAQVALAAPDDGTRQQALKQILLSVDRTSRLVRQLLALARLDSGSPGRIEEVRIGDALREVVDAMPHRSDVAVDIDPALDDALRALDREALQLLLRNLHENAVQHAREGGRVRWSLAGDGRSLIVEDDGPGIADDEMELVRQRFYRGKGARVSAGTGLGLSISDQSAARLGAKLHLGNRADARGLRVEIRFPPGPPGHG